MFESLTAGHNTMHLKSFGGCVDIDLVWFLWAGIFNYSAFTPHTKAQLVTGTGNGMKIPFLDFYYLVSH